MTKDIENRKFNRVISIMLTILLTLLMIPTDTIADDNMPEYDGYIVSLNENVDVKLDRDTELEEIVKDEIYQADTISEIRKEIPACDIDYIEPNYVIKVCDTYLPNDAKYPEQRWAQDIMNVQKVWDRGYFGSYANSSDAPTVAIIDSGILGTGNSSKKYHEDLNYTNIETGINVISSNYNTNDDLGHGTFISGIIAGIHNNAVGIVGDMPNIKLRAYKCLDSQGSGNLAGEAKSINAAIKDSVDVINLSLGFIVGTHVESEAINKATEKGIIVCASSGNYGNSMYNYPASLENVISVASINSQGTRSKYSQYNDKVDCAAPGENILSLDYRKIDGYKTANGTSFSCPQVSALAAMCKSIDSTIDHDRFMELLKSTSRDAGTAGYDTSYGWGIVDYGNMLDALVPEDNSIWSADITGISAEADYTGSAITFDNLKITMPSGKELSAGSDYTVTYYNNIKKGMGMLTIKGIGDYSGRINKYFQIGPVEPEKPQPTPSPIFDPTNTDPVVDPEPTPDPIIDPEPMILKAPTIKKLATAKKSFKLTWKKVSGIDGYRLQYSTSKTFKKGTYKKLTVAKSKTSYTVKKLKSKKKYYVRMRCYKLIDGQKQYSNWTKTKAIRTK